MTRPSPIEPSPVSLFYDPTLIGYPETPPFDPSQRYPEDPSSNHVQMEANRVYDAVRQTLAQLGLDKEHFGQPEWNPLGELVAPGGSVVIKPNLVDLKQGWIALGRERVLDMVSHGSVLRPLVDYAYRAVGPSGMITLGDAPLVHADFEGVVEGAGIRPMIEALAARGVPIRLMDLREEFFGRFTGEYKKLPGIRWATASSISAGTAP